MDDVYFSTKMPMSSVNFMNYINENCSVDEHSGDLYCVKCHCKVHVDFFEEQLECSGCDDL